MRPLERQAAMTIGIGVLCSTQPQPHRPRPDAFVLISDTMGSTETDSTQDLNKLYIQEEVRLFAVCGNRTERCGDLLPVIGNAFSNLPRRTYGTVLEAINKAVHGHRAQYFKYDVINVRHSLVDGVLSTPTDKIMEDWEKYNPGVELIIGTFDVDAKALLYQIGLFYDANGVRDGGWVHPIAYPGFAMFGSGAYNASMWLNYRRQRLGLNIVQSALHAYEASRMAASAPTVNDDIEIVVALKDRFFYMSRETPTPSGSPISITQLQTLARRHGPRSTDVLGFTAGPRHRRSTTADQLPPPPAPESPKASES